MEGPFSVEVEPASAKALRLNCVERRSRRTVRMSVLVDLRSLAESAMRSSEAALRLCRAKGWWSADADALDSGLAELRKAVAASADEAASANWS